MKDKQFLKVNSLDRLRPHLRDFYLRSGLGWSGIGRSNGPFFHGSNRPAQDNLMEKPLGHVLGILELTGTKLDAGFLPTRSHFDPNGHFCVKTRGSVFYE